MSGTVRDGQIHPIIARTPSLHFAQFKAFFFLKPIFSVFSSTCFFHVFFGRLHFLLPLTLRSRAALKTLVIPLQHMSIPLTPFTVANRSITSFSPSMSICSLVVFLSTTFQLPMALFILLKIAFLFSFKYYALLSCSNADLMQHNKFYPSSSEETHFQAVTFHIS